MKTQEKTSIPPKELAKFSKSLIWGLSISEGKWRYNPETDAFYKSFIRSIRKW
ncbi:hypothetical protein DSBG_2332 [Desulfosporosinus sp. BG]|nr:hypothetical protein DSBG_2332 [Desulfosporosinus sp. BG]